MGGGKGGRGEGGKEEGGKGERRGKGSNEMKFKR